MFILDMIRAASREIRRNFFKAGYKIGAAVGTLGGSELAHGFSSGLRKMAEAAVEKATMESNLHELIETELGNLLEDAMADAHVGHPIGNIWAGDAFHDHPIDPIEHEQWSEEALEEMSHNGLVEDVLDELTDLPE